MKYNIILFASYKWKGETNNYTMRKLLFCGPTNYRKTPQDTARHRKTPQDTARHPQDTARHCKTATRHCKGPQERRMQGYYRYSGVWWWWWWWWWWGEVELSQKLLGEHFYCIFAWIVKKQNLEKIFFVKIFFLWRQKKMFTIFFQVLFFHNSCTLAVSCRCLAVSCGVLRCLAVSCGN